MMIEKDIDNSRKLDEEFWDEFIERYGDEDVRELLEFADDCINIPDLMEYLSNYNNIVLVGGGIDECLKEVEIALNALDKPYTTIPKFICKVIMKMIRRSAIRKLGLIIVINPRVFLVRCVLTIPSLLISGTMPIITPLVLILALFGLMKLRLTLTGLLLYRLLMPISSLVIFCSVILAFARCLCIRFPV